MINLKTYEWDIYIPFFLPKSSRCSVCLTPAACVSSDAPPSPESSSQRKQMRYPAISNILKSLPKTKLSNKL